MEREVQRLIDGYQAGFIELGDTPAGWTRRVLPEREMSAGGAAK